MPSCLSEKETRNADSVLRRTATLTSPSIHQFVRDYAPIFHLHPDERYQPTDLELFLSHVRPQINFQDVPSTITTSQSLTLSNLDKYNVHGEQKGEDVYLTSCDDVAENPTWLNGVQKIDSNGGAEPNRTGAIIILDRGPFMYDVFYFVFWAFNYAGVVLGNNLGNHVGDWEHVMIRFKNSKPTKVWLSQHANGEAYSFKALEKDPSGKRPILYVAKGTHAIYARTGDIDHTIPNFNTTLPLLLVDQCAKGPKYDPLLTSYAYSYNSPVSAVSETAGGIVVREADYARYFTPLTPASPEPGWLKFKGHWGDETYPASDPRQNNLLSFHKYEGGPTGPAFKDLVRERVWPANSHAWGQIVRTSLDGSTRLRDQFKRWRWKCCGSKDEKMKVQGQPTRVFVDGTPAPVRNDG